MEQKVCFLLTAMFKLCNRVIVSVQRQKRGSSMELIIPTLLKVFNNYISLLLLSMLLVRLFVVIENEDGFSDVSSPSRLNLKRLYSFSQSPQFKEMKYSHHSSIEELVSQQLQRNEMDGINQIRFAATPSIPKNV